MRKTDQQNKQEIIDFVQKNEEALKILAQKVKNLDSLKGIDTIKELLARKKAIRIVSEWLYDIWGITTEELPNPEEDDNLFKIIN